MRYYFLEGIEPNELISGKCKKVCTALNYVEHFLILAFAITGCIAISAFWFFVWCSNRNYKFSDRIKNLCNNFRM